MKKQKKNPVVKKNKKYLTENSGPGMQVHEPVSDYPVVKKIPQQKEYTFERFEALSSQLPFTLKEWASVIHLSDRTLQRYAKENKAIEGIHADRLLQVEKVINEAGKVFKKPTNFYDWLNERHTVLGNVLSIDSLQTQDGIQMLLDELGRIQQGVYI